MASALRIGELASAAGVTTDAVRYYERLKILPRPTRVRILARLSDLRVVQFWDHGQLVAQTLRESLPAEEGTDINPDPLSDPILWDVVGIYPPGKRWTDKLPTPSFFDGPVNDVVSRVKEMLEQPVLSRSL